MLGEYDELSQFYLYKYIYKTLWYNYESDIYFINILFKIGGITV